MENHSQSPVRTIIHTQFSVFSAVLILLVYQCIRGSVTVLYKFKIDIDTDISQFG